MKKWESTGDCDTCMGRYQCSTWKKECGSNNCLVYPGDLEFGNIKFRYYANKQECERLLKLWDDANGSIAEWRENDIPMKKFYEDNRGCCSCYWYELPRAK